MEGDESEASTIRRVPSSPSLLRTRGVPTGKKLEDSWVLMKDEEKVQMETNWQVLPAKEGSTSHSFNPPSLEISPCDSHPNLPSVFDFRELRSKRPANSSNVELFSLVKILSLSTEKKAKDKPASQQTAPKPSLMAAFLSTEAQTLRGAKQTKGEDSTVTIELCANGGHEGHDFIALYLSNDYFVFRYVGESGLPTMRQLPWYRDALRKVKSMDFNPSSQWLACVTADFSVVLIPVYFLLAHGRPTGGSMSDLKAVDAGFLASEEVADLESIWDGVQSGPGWFGSKKSTARKGAGSIGSISDVTVIRSASHPNPSQVTHCKWWRTWSGEDYIIIASFSGSLRFVNVRSHAVTRIKTKHPIVKLDLMIDPGKSFKYLIIHTHQGGYWQLVIETKAAFGAYDSIVSEGSTSKFEPQPLARFNKPGLRVVRQVSRGSPFVGAIDTETKRMELYDVHLSKFPVYAFRLADDTSTLRIANVTDKLLFVLTKEKEEYVLSVVSRLLASVGNNTSNSRQFSTAILEQFEFPPDQKPTGYFRGFGEHYYPSAKPTISIDSKDEAMEPLEGFFIWTKDAIYELVPKKAPERIFCDLLASNDYKDAEAVGKTFELDVLRLYELVADEYFELGEHGRALELYYLSGVKTSKLVSKFMAIDRADIVLTKLRSMMFHSERLSAVERKAISNTLLKCYLQRYCQSQDEISMEELSTFLQSNSDYDTAKALTLCLEHGLVKSFLSTAHARNTMDRALAMLVNEKGPATLRPEHFEFLLEHNYGELLKSVNDGVLIAALPPSSQLDFYLADRISIVKSLPKIQNLLPLLDEDSLVRLASFLDPRGSTFEENFALGRRPRQVSFGADKSESSSTALTSDIATETYLFTLMTLSQLQHILGRAAPAPSVAFEPLPLPTTPAEKPQTPNKKTIVVTKIACGWNHVLALSADGNVFAWGRNSHGELGVGSTEDQRSPALVASLLGHGIAHIAAGGHHSVVADSVGFTWAWGSGKRGQLGSEVLASATLPQRVEGLVGNRVLDLACGYDFTVALTEKGLFVWGSGHEGQIPCDDPKGIVAVPTKIPLSNLKIANVCCGRLHTALLTTLGEVWTFGNGSNGQLGHGTSRNEDKPRLVEGLLGKTIKSVSCGSYHTIALTEIKNVYTWGSGSDASATAATSLPHIVESLRSKNMVMVSSGDFHSVAVTESGEVFAWSSEASGEITAKSPVLPRVASSSSMDSPFEEVKRTTSASSRFPPVSVPALSGKKIKAIVCGDHVTVVLSESGNVYSWGSGEYGQLGHGDLLDLQAPKKIDPLLFSEASLHRTLTPKVSTKKTISKLPRSSSSRNAAQGEQFTEAHLHEALRSLKGRYRHRVVLHKAGQLSSLTVLASLFELEGAWSQAISARLTLLEQSPADPAPLLALLASLLRGPLSDPECKEKENLLFAILSAWALKLLPPTPLEDFFRKNFDAVAPTLGLIFERNSSDLPLAVAFSDAFYLDLTERFVSAMTAPRAEREGKPTSTRLIDQIVANVGKDEHRNSRIVIQPKEIKGTRRSPDEADVIFSCGHGYTRSYLLDELTPKLQDRLSELSSSLSLTSKLIVAEYHQRNMSLACPVCLFNELRKGFQKPSSRWDL